MPKTNKKTAKNSIRDHERRLRRLKAAGDAAAAAAAEAKLEALRAAEAEAAEQRARVDREKRYAERYRRRPAHQNL